MYIAAFLLIQVPAFAHRIWFLHTHAQIHPGFFRDKVSAHSTQLYAPKTRNCGNRGKHIDTAATATAAAIHTSLQLSSPINLHYCVGEAAAMLREIRDSPSTTSNHDVIVVWDLMEIIRGLRHVDNVVFLYIPDTHRLYYGCYNHLNSSTTKCSPAVDKWVSKASLSSHSRSKVHSVIVLVLVIVLIAPVLAIVAMWAVLYTCTLGYGYRRHIYY
jgi:hypothetical protein